MMKHLLEEIGRLLLLTGNCGRTLRRFLARLFPDNAGLLLEVTTNVQYPLHDPVLDTLLLGDAVAVAVQKVQYALQLRGQLRGNAPGLALQFTLLPLQVDELGVAAVRITPPAVQTVAEMHEVLEQLHYALTALAPLRDNPVRAMEQRRRLDETYLWLAQASDRRVEFNRLVAGDLTGLDYTPLAVVGHAARFNPAVEVALGQR